MLRPSGLWDSSCGALLLLAFSLVGCGSDARHDAAAPAKSMVKPLDAPEARQSVGTAGTAPSVDASEGTVSNDSDAEIAGELSISCRRWPVPEPGSPIVAQLTIEELQSEVRRNWKETDARFAGQLLELSGVVEHVGKNMGGEPYVRLRGPDEHFQITCVLRSAAAASQVAEGETCRVRGVYSNSVIPSLIHCEVVGNAEPQSMDEESQPPVVAAPAQRDVDMTITAKQFDSDITRLKEKATAKYAGKIVQMSGRLKMTSHVVHGEIVYYLDVGGILGIQCYLRSGSPWSCVRPGQHVTVVGEGFRSSPCLVNCEVITAGGEGLPTFESQSMATLLESDRAAFQKSYNRKQLIIRGNVTEITSPKGRYPTHVITLSGTPTMPIVCEMNNAESTAATSVKVGDTVTILALNNFNNPEVPPLLLDCLFWRGD